jgi:hypothetical protein
LLFTVELYRFDRRRLLRWAARQLGFEVRHVFWRRLIGSAGVRYTSTPYQDVDVIARELVAELGLDDYVGCDTILFGRHQHIAFDSTQPVSGSNADVVRLGVRLRYCRRGGSAKSFASSPRRVGPKSSRSSASAMLAIRNPMRPPQS